MLTAGQLREIVRTAPIYKMSLGKSARYQVEALSEGVLVFQSERDLYESVGRGDEAAIHAAGKRVRNKAHSKGGSPDKAIEVWRRSIETFCALPNRSLILHWEAEFDHLHWGLSGEPFTAVRNEVNEFGQEGIVFHRPLIGGWRRASIGDVPLSNIHPAARALAINQATLNRVRTDDAYFRSLILDESTEAWERRVSWEAAAKRSGWHPKARSDLLMARRAKRRTETVVDIAEHFYDDIARMAGTAIHTAAYANGQTVLATVKPKDIGFTRVELEEEIAGLLRAQSNCCRLTGFAFRTNHPNPHLRPSLDRVDSSLGYIPGNLQIVTRAANFYKSASDASDWEMKAQALIKMASTLYKRNHIK